MAECPFCFNAHVWAKEPKTEEDYFDRGLDDTNDASSHTIGKSGSIHSMYINSGNGEPVSIEVCEWKKNGYRGNDGYVTVSIYYPKYCPECGRKLDEYIIDERGTNYDTRRY